jgi:peptide/nickel transport system substrate-binding protein
MTTSRTTRSPWLPLVLVATLLLAGCGAQPVATEPPSAPTEGAAAQPTTEPATEAPYVEVLRLPGGGYWGHPSPFGFNRGPGFVRASLVFDTLVWRDASGETIPWLATDWSLSDDGLTWTFTLRDGVRWQDGQPLTAEDVVFSFEYALAHPGAGWFMAQVDAVASAEVVGENQVAIRLVRPYAPFLQAVAEALLIFPRHIWQDVTDPQAFA